MVAWLDGVGTWMDLEGLGVGDQPQSCVWDSWLGAWCLMRSGGKWSRFCSNTAEQQVFAGHALFLSNFLRVD